MPKFDKAAFLAKNKEAKAGGGDFPPIEPGIYNVTLERAGFRQSSDPTSESESLSLGFQIDEEDDRHPKQYVWHNQTVTNRDGQINEVGYQDLNHWLIKMSSGLFDPSEFCGNPEQTLDKFIGTQLKVKIESDGEYQGKAKHKVRFQSLIESAYAQKNGSPPPTGKEESFEEEATLTEQPTEEEEDGGVELEVGHIISYQNKKGKTVNGEVTSFVETPDGSAGIVMVTTDGVPVAVPQGSILGIESGDIEEEEELEEELELKKGAFVEYTFKGEKQVHPVHSISEDDGTLKVVLTKEGKKIARKLNISDVKVVETPF